MVSVADVAAFILDKKGEMTTWKLQKLVYYSQAWSLVWDEEALFEEEIQAWANGPVVPRLYEHHKGKFKLKKEDIPSSDPTKLNDNQRETVGQIVETYGKKQASGQVILLMRKSPGEKQGRGPLQCREEKKLSLGNLLQISMEV